MRRWWSCRRLRDCSTSSWFGTMYSPGHFRIEDRATIFEFIHTYSSATIVTHDGVESHAAHMPVVLREHIGAHGVLATHVPKASPQAEHLASGREVLVTFQG